LFGNNQNKTSTGSFFGNTNNTNSGTSLFGNNQQQQQGNSLFGNNTNNSGSLFGNTQNKPLFGNTNNSGTSLFNNTNTNQNQQNNAPAQNINLDATIQQAGVRLELLFSETLRQNFRP